MSTPREPMLLLTDIDEPHLNTLPVYEQRGGYESLRKALALTPEEVEEGWILTCQGLPSGRTVSVEYEAM